MTHSGLCVMFAVIVLATGRDLPRNRVTEFTAGLASGTFALVASIGGPPIALLYRNAKGPTLRSNLAAVFIVGLLITIGTRVLADRLTTSDVVVAAFLLPAILLAGIASGPLAKRIEGSVLRVTVLLVASLAAVGLFWRTFA